MTVGELKRALAAIDDNIDLLVHSPDYMFELEKVQLESTCNDDNPYIVRVYVDHADEE